MRVKYFADTDTTLFEFSNTPPAETRKLNENIYFDLDSEGRVVSLTIEHASQSTNVEEFLYQRIFPHLWRRIETERPDRFHRQLCQPDRLRGL